MYSLIFVLLYSSFTPQQFFVAGLLIYNIVFGVPAQAQKVSPLRLSTAQNMSNIFIKPSTLFDQAKRKRGYFFILSTFYYSNGG